jgi:hypothetical protein
MSSTIRTEAANSLEIMADLLSTTRRHIAQHRILAIGIGTSNFGVLVAEHMPHRVVLNAVNVANRPHKTLTFVFKLKDKSFTCELPPFAFCVAENICIPADERVLLLVLY